MRRVSRLNKVPLALVTAEIIVSFSLECKTTFSKLDRNFEKVAVTSKRQPATNPGNGGKR